ncbi:MAG: hypothetical protein ACXVMS_05175 [Flavisolibacter sp.]
MGFLPLPKKHMQPSNDPIRNRPSEEGRKNDPDLRDESAAQPGTSTMSSSQTDDANQKLTETAADGFREKSKDPKADPDLDDSGQGGA